MQVRDPDPSFCPPYHTALGAAYQVYIVACSLRVSWKQQEEMEITLDSPKNDLKKNLKGKKFLN